MNIFYGIAFLVIIYYISQWMRNSKLLSANLSEQYSKINNKIQKQLREQLSHDSSLIEGFSSYQSPMTSNNIFKSVKVNPDDKRDNCNSMFLPNAYKGVYKNEIVDGMYNYASMKKYVNV